MKTSALSFVAFGASLVAAQLAGIDKLPPCVKGCVSNLLGGQNVAGCESLDVTCLCGKAEFITTMNTCVREQCDQAGVDAAAQFAYNLCLEFGVTIETNAPSPTAPPSGPSSTAAPAPTITGGNNTTNVSTSGSPPGPTETNTTGAASVLAAGGISILGGAVAAFLLL